MNLKSKIIRILYFSENKKVKGKDKLINLLENELDHNTDTEKLEESVQSVSNYGLVSIKKREQNSIYSLTEDGVDRVESLLSGSELENKIKNAVS